jgi:hypothetical protein
MAKHPTKAIKTVSNSQCLTTRPVQRANHPADKTKSDKSPTPEVDGEEGGVGADDAHM